MTTLCDVCGNPADTVCDDCGADLCDGDTSLLDGEDLCWDCYDAKTKNGSKNV